MNSRQHGNIRVLIADDDERILECYRDAFGDNGSTNSMKALDSLEAELFDSETDITDVPHFELVACRQGSDAVSLAQEATRSGKPFNVIILDVRMPPGIDGVEAGSRIREFDHEAEIIFVSGFSDVPRDELERRVPPPMRLHYFNKPLSFMQLAQDVASMVEGPASP